MKRNDQYATMIKDQFPDVSIQSVESLGEGSRNYAILVNEEWVFRFPKSQQGADELNKEIQLLPLLVGCVKVSIPQFVYIGRQSDGSPFVGYRKVPGEILGEDGMNTLRDHVKDRFALELADFMNVLSSIPVEIALHAGVPIRNPMKEILLLKEAVEQQTFPLINESLRDYLSLRFQSYLEHPGFHRYTPALIHGDLSPDHFLTDPHLTSLTGIIDFGDATVSDPVYDYVYLLEDCGEPFTRQVMACKGEVGLDELVRKVSLFVTFDQVSYLIEGLKAGDRAWINEGLELLEEDRATYKS